MLSKLVIWPFFLEAASIVWSPSRMIDWTNSSGKPPRVWIRHFTFS